MYIFTQTNDTISFLFLLMYAISCLILSHILVVDCALHKFVFFLFSSCLSTYTRTHRPCFYFLSNSIYFYSIVIRRKLVVFMCKKKKKTKLNNCVVYFYSIYWQCSLSLFVWSLEPCFWHSTLHTIIHSILVEKKN